MVPSTAPDVLVVCHDVVGDRMAGPGIRYLNLARQLSHYLDVALAAPAGSTLPQPEPFGLLVYADAQDPGLRDCASRVSVVLLPSVWATNLVRNLPESVHVVIDGYDPVLIEAISLGMEDVSGLLDSLTRAYLSGDFFLCASERQRDWWIGLLEGVGRINPQTVSDDPSLRRLIATVPYGLPAEPASLDVHTPSVIREVWSGVAATDKVLLWGGGLWSWLDPLTAVRAVARVCDKRRDVRLIFPGTRHPNPVMADVPTQVHAARDLADSLGLLDRYVFFGDWVPHSQWRKVLLESDVALTLHSDTLESRLAFRSRVLDYIWAGLPTIATRGDATSDLIAEYGLGIVTDYGDADGVAVGILRLLELSPEAWDDRFSQARSRLSWDRVSQPLIEYCKQPYAAPDRSQLESRGSRHANSPISLGTSDNGVSLQDVEGHSSVRVGAAFRALIRAIYLRLLG